MFSLRGHALSKLANFTGSAFHAAVAAIQRVVVELNAIAIAALAAVDGLALVEADAAVGRASLQVDAFVSAERAHTKTTVE